MKVLSVFIAFILFSHVSVGTGQEQEKKNGENLFTSKFQSVTAVSIDPSGRIYVVDGGANEIYKYNSDGSFLLKVGGAGWGDVSFDHPTDIVTQNVLDVYVSDYGNHRIQHLDRNLNFISSLKIHDDVDAKNRLGYPMGIAVDRFGALYVIDGEDSRIVKIKGNVIERIFGGLDAGEGRLHHPSAIKVSNEDIVYVVDDGEINEYDLFGNFINKYEKHLFTHLECISLLDNALVVLDSSKAIIMGASKKDTLNVQIPQKDDLGAFGINGVCIYKNTMIGWSEHRVEEIPYFPPNEEK